MQGRELPLIQVRNVSYFYGTQVALDRVSFSVDSGEALFVLGGNGAGKSTLLSVLAGLLRPEVGEVWYRNVCLSRIGAARAKDFRRRSGYFAHTSYLYNDLSIEENLNLLARCYGGDIEPDRVEELLFLLGLDSFRSRRIRECSQGIAKRAGLARALLANPELLFLDEPLSHLDSRTQEIVIDTLRAENTRGVTLVVASHEGCLMRELATRSLVLQSGRLDRTLSRRELQQFALAAC